MQKRVLSSASSRPHLLVYSFTYLPTHLNTSSSPLFPLSLFFPLRHLYLPSAQHTVSSAASLYLVSSITTPSFRSSPSCVYVCVCSPRLTLVLTPSSLFLFQTGLTDKPKCGPLCTLRIGRRAEGRGRPPLWLPFARVAAYLCLFGVCSSFPAHVRHVVSPNFSVKRVCMSFVVLILFFLSDSLTHCASARQAQPFFLPHPRYTTLLYFR